MLAKGQRVAIDGRLRYSSWEAQDGSRRSKLEVVVEEIEFMSPRQGGGRQAAPAAAAPATSAAGAGDLYDEDIPF